MSFTLKKLLRIKSHYSHPSVQTTRRGVLFCLLEFNAVNQACNAENYQQRTKPEKQRKNSVSGCKGWKKAYNGKFFYQIGYGKKHTQRNCSYKQSASDRKNAVHDHRNIIKLHYHKQYAERHK